jgi:hypothetical protein
MYNTLVVENNALKREMADFEQYKKKAMQEVESIREIAQKYQDDIAAQQNAELYRQTAAAMKNIIEGYGDAYIIPTQTLLDELAETYGYTQAGNDLKKARAASREIVRGNRAGSCDYVETKRGDMAVRFVVDAFNGKVESILSRVKSDNYGKLKQEMIDAYNLVNYNGQPFRNAKITEEYFNARAEELRLACIVHGIRQRDIEEQRRIKEQMREEEKDRREIEKALRDSAREEEMLQKAIAKAKEQMAAANEGQRLVYERQIAELERKWQEAEERNKRAVSMAQQTKSGHVYIISNIGSFGENVYKIGMTRRLEPMDRVRELGDASVPFAFDVHAMIWSTDAPALEAKLHNIFALCRLNKVNARKEFFRTTIETIKNEMESSTPEIEVKWTIAAVAQEYRESLAIEREIFNDPEKQKAWLAKEFELESRRPLISATVGGEDDDEEE